eukprot:CFRG2849T1
MSSKRAAAKNAAKEKELNLPTVPKHVQVIQSILSSMGVENYEPRVVNQLLEFTYRYVSEVLENAKVYSEHSGKTKVDVDDVRLSIQSKVNFSFTAPPPREFQMDLAQKRNAQKLHDIPQRMGVRLPPERYCLSAMNYQVEVDKDDYNPEGIPNKVMSSVPSKHMNDKGGGTFKKPTAATIPVQVNQNAVLQASNGSGMAPAGFTVGSVMKRKFDDDDDYD